MENIFDIKVAEFFAGIGLVRVGLEQAGCKVVFANDISEKKHAIYSANFDDSMFRLDDIRNIKGCDVPEIDIATASFPCTNLSLAGSREGLKGEQSGTILEFLRVLEEMNERRPAIVFLENVVGLISSNDGDDLRVTITRMNELGYSCDLLKVDAKIFVPQSRPRLFVVGLRKPKQSEWSPSEVRPPMIFNFVRKYPTLRYHFTPLPKLPRKTKETLEDIIEYYDENNDLWWEVPNLGAFLNSLSTINAIRLEKYRRGKTIVHATAYRRTRNHKAVWEIRSDHISGCLRTTGGGSSRQALVEAGQGNVRVRWMTKKEYARLQGAPNFNIDGFTESESKYALGDAVCVPVIQWIAKNYLIPEIYRLYEEAHSIGVAVNA